MEPLHEDVPERIDTERLVLRSAQRGDAEALNAAVLESLDDLRVRMPWAQAAPTLAQSEADCRRLQAKFLLREDLPMFVFERRADGGEGAFVGGTGLHRIDWRVRRFEIGYWCRSSRLRRGYVTEAVRALTRVAFERLRARRVEVRMDATNERSWRVAQRAGFELEGVFACDSLTPAGEPRDTRVYALVAEGVTASGHA
ncbi:MAG TPA: GNAT family N-acetyltransferase [Burkholderiaceae bacterium]|nr:GNAT family N-acetyltransferase [Burkholderiaceae bacterium]